MPRLAANLAMLFTEVPFLERFRRAARAGFTAVEYLFPYSFDMHVLRNELTEHRLQQVLFNLTAGDWDGGERGIACIPSRVTEFRASVDRSIAYAKVLGCTQLNCLAGVVPPDIPETVARETFLSNLRYAAERLKTAGINLLIEPVNTQDVPGFFVSTAAQALELRAAVGAENLFLQCDVYHMSMMGEDVEGFFTTSMNAVAHIQIADVPGRHEPGTGGVNFEALFATLDREGYSGWVGCEYKPLGRTDGGLNWAMRYLSADV